MADASNGRWVHRAAALVLVAGLTFAGLSADAVAAINFAPKQDVAVSGPSSLAIGDFNGDRKPDLAVTSRDQATYTGGVAILLGSGTGTFGAPVSVATPAGQWPYGVTVGDFNGDGLADLAVVDTSPSYSNVDTHGSILLGDGTGAFAGSAVLVASGITAPYAVAAGDVNGDGRQDLVAAGLRFRSGGASPIGLIAPLLGDGTGAFTQGTVSSGGEVRRALALGDLNADGRLDVVTADSGRDDFPGFGSALLGDGGGGFGEGPGTTSRLDAGTGSTSVALGDFNGDGRPDMAVANYNSDDVSVFVGNGAGGFAGASAFPAHDGSRSVAVGDFDGDGAQDLAVANAGSDDISVLQGTGTGAFAAPIHLPAGDMSALVEASRNHGDGGRLEAGDLDCNGTLDLVMAGDASGTVSVLMNARPGTAPAGCEPDTTGPAVRIVSRALRLTSTGAVAVQLRCPADEPAGCASTVRLRTASKVRVSPTKRRVVTLGTVKRQLRAGRTATARIKLSSANRRLVRRLGRVRVKVTVQAVDQAQNSRSVSKTLTLRRP